MTNVFTNSACASAILFFGFAGLYAYAWLANPNPQADKSGIHWSYVSFGNGLHIAVTKEFGGNVVFFNQNMPYQGSIITLAGDNTVGETGFTGAGIYFRHIIHTVETDKNWWTLMISLWYPIIVFAVLPLVFVIKKLRPTAKGTTAHGTQS